MADASFSEKLDGVIEGLAGFFGRYAGTFKLLLLRPHKAPGLLLNRDAASKAYLPPFTFLVVSYLALISLVQIWEEFTGLRETEADEDPLRVGVKAVANRLENIDPDPVKLLALALPVLAVVLGCAWACRRLTRLDRSLVVGTLAYTLSFALVFGGGAIALVTVMFALPSGTGAAPMDDLLFSAALLPAVVAVLLVPAVYVLFMLVFLVNALLMASEGRTGWKSLAAPLALLAATLAVHYLDLRIVYQNALGLLVEEPEEPLTVDVRVLDLVLESRPPLTLAVSAIDEWGLVGLPPDSRPRTPGFPVRVTAALENRSSRTIYLSRGGTTVDSTRHRLEVGFVVSPGEIAHDGEVQMAVESWSAGEGPVLVLEPGSIRWITLAGRTDGYASAEAFRERAVRLLLDLPGDLQLEGGWLELHVQPAAIPGSPGADSTRPAPAGPPAADTTAGPG